MLLPEDDHILHRVGVIGDIHCEDEALARVLHHFRTLQVDTILSVGDITDGLGDVNRACMLLREHNVFTVAGNHDRWTMMESMRTLPNATPKADLADEHHAWLQQLPKTITFKTPMGALLLCHGLGENDMAMVRSSHDGYAIEANLDLQTLIKSKRYRFIVNGHSHEPMVRTIKGVTFINGGTLDRHDRQVCTVVNFDKAEVDFYDIDEDTISKAELFPLN
ncbi:MAG TPA: metallophosphoesterase family protein [Terriglobales bacterium]|nr:metallophosphoesterase family protein [Terriglobales bacterium]